MTKISVYFFTLITLGLFSLVTNVSGEELKIGFVNTDRVFKEAAPAIRSQKKLQDEFAPRDQEIKDVNAKATEVKALGKLFCDKGVLDRRLLPWLWRDLKFSLARRPDEIDFMLSLLTELGLLTLLPHQQERQG